MLRCVLWVVMVMAGASAWAQGPPSGSRASGGGSGPGLFDTYEERAVSALVTAGEEGVRAMKAAGFAEPPRSSMLRELMGVLGELKTVELQVLRGSVRTRVSEGNIPTDASRVGVVHLKGRKSVKRVEVLRTWDGEVWAREIDVDGKAEEGGRGARLDATRMGGLVAGWQRGERVMGRDGERGAGMAGAEDVGVVYEMKRPYQASVWRMDDETISDRLARSRNTNLKEAERDLSSETMLVRLPRGLEKWEAGRGVGVLAWVDPSGSGAPPEVMHAAADEMGFVIVGVKGNGNDRAIADRFQLTLDSVETVRARWRVDKERVYVVGMSGGGRVASMLWATFPDEFTGAVAIVGMNVWKNIPIGDGRWWRGTFSKPSAERLGMLRGHRMAGIGGDKDGNTPQMRAYTAFLEGEGLAVRLFSYADMGHTMPTGERFREALAWVDAGVAERRAKEASAAAAALEKYRARWGDAAVTTAAQRSALDGVAEAGPWSEAGWEAARLLGLRTRE